MWHTNLVQSLRGNSCKSGFDFALHVLSCVVQISTPLYDMGPLGTELESPATSLRLDSDLDWFVGIWTILVMFIDKHVARDLVARDLVAKVNHVPRTSTTLYAALHCQVAVRSPPEHPICNRYTPPALVHSNIGSFVCKGEQISGDTWTFSLSMWQWATDQSEWF